MHQIRQTVRNRIQTLHKILKIKATSHQTRCLFLFNRYSRITDTNHRSTMRMNEIILFIFPLSGISGKSIPCCAGIRHESRICLQAVSQCKVSSLLHCEEARLSYETYPFDEYRENSNMVNGVNEKTRVRGIRKFHPMCSVQ